MTESKQLEKAKALHKSSYCSSGNHNGCRHQVGNCQCICHKYPRKITIERMKNLLHGFRWRNAARDTASIVASYYSDGLLVSFHHRKVTTHIEIPNELIKAIMEVKSNY